MGVQDLWSTIGPIRESVPLYSLTGQTLAVDLSLWVCEAQHVQAMMGRVTKPHLRNLFFRVLSLTLMGIKLVFVMEGEAPKLKAETMSKRTESRFGGVKKAPSKSTKNTTTIKSTGRGRFMAVLRECADMLDCLGVPWVTAAGEAEAMCAYLDSQGLVDGCITNDGDAFLYGAKTVYRNFSTTTKDPLVDCYRTSRVQSELHLSREDLVGLAILLGCDYIPKGIHGVGKEHVLKLIQKLKGQTLLQRFRQWQEEGPCVPVGATKKVAHCKLCLHPGSAKAHEQQGCLLCHSRQFCQPQDYDYQCPCDWHRTTQQANSFEAGIRKKTLASEHFPFTEIIEEFLISKDKPVPKFRWGKPNMLPMQKFALLKMEWPKHYTSEKVLVLMTYTDLMNRICRKEASSQIKPLRILKPRVRNGVACLEIVWSTPEHYAFPEDNPLEGQGEVRTVEEEALFSRAYPDVVERYQADKALAEEDKTKKKKVKSKKEKPTDVCDGLTVLLAHINLQNSAGSEPDACEQSAPPPPPTAPEHSPETFGVDLPAPQSQQPKHPQLGEDRCPPHCVESASSFATRPAAAASPSVSAIVDLLHLSDIDWDGSFTSSPRASPAPSASTAEPWGAPEAGGGVEESLPTGGVAPGPGPAGPRPAQEVGYMERPLRERLLMRNMAVTGQTKTTEDPLTKHLDHQSQGPHGAAPGKAAPSTQLSDKHYALDGNKTSKCSQSSTSKASRDRHVSQLCALASAQGRSKGIYAGSRAPRTHSDSVTAALSSASIIPRQRHFDPVTLGNGDRKPPPQGAKRSVCTAACSSSEESGAENRPAGAERRAKSKSLRHTKLKPASKAPAAPKRDKSSGWSSSGSTSQAVQRPEASPDECFIDGLPETSPGQDVFIACAPSSPVTILDSDDSLSGGESPLPLAERLRLKYLM
ncbi:flap endonuclease GEN homolog 1 isoform X1 [Gadus morhua]|uniref:Flap endonuclease GEN homolog 1 n=1 Tax=Gadus morhua TaxID=8049 RepID=A0A8C5FH03_GADMO|nr:flap endonuclease GEN homolog 1 isoform X1 [Gadus morhua]